MSRRRLVEHVPLLLWTAPLAALIVGAIVAVAEIDKVWAVALACVALVATTVAMALVTRSFLLDKGRRRRRGGLWLPVAAARGGSLRGIRELSKRAQRPHGSS